MKKGSATAAEEAGVDLYQFYHMPTLDLIGWLWYDDGELRYEQNEFSQNDVATMVRGYARMHNIPLDNADFIDALRGMGSSYALIPT